MGCDVLARAIGTTQHRYTRPKEHQFPFYMALAMLAYMVASLFGSYGALSFTYLIVGVAWLAATTLGRGPWYVSPRTAMALQASAARAR